MGHTGLNRRRFLSAVGAGAAVLSAGPLVGTAGANQSSRRAGGRSDIPQSRTGIQLFTVRDLTADNELGVAGTLELVADAGYSEIELAGTYYDMAPADLRSMAEGFGLKIVGNHFGPRSLVQNIWYDPAERARIFEEAHALGLEQVGTGHSYIAPLTVDGYKEMAEAFSVWGEDAVNNGFDYFYFHNHDMEFTIVEGRPLYHILVEESDPRYVKFQVDLGWMSVAGEDAHDLLRRDPSRFPLFHVKDLMWDPNGNRTARPGTTNGGQTFFFTDVGKGVVDWARIFSALDNTNRHHFLAEHDDAVDDETPDATSPRPLNPAGSANTAWTSRKYLSELRVPRRRRG